VQELGGGKIFPPERQKAIGRRLRHAIHALDAVKQSAAEAQER